jgi:hypothetical protein
MPPDHHAWCRRLVWLTCGTTAWVKAAATVDRRQCSFGAGCSAVTLLLHAVAAYAGGSGVLVLPCLLL